MAFPVVNRFCAAFLHGRAGRLTAQTGDFRPGQCEVHLRIARAALDAIPAELIFASAIEDRIAHSLDVDIGRLQTALQFPEANVHQLLRQDDFDRCCTRLARDFVSIHITTVLSMSTKSLLASRQAQAGGRTAREILVRDQLANDTVHLKKLLGSVCSEDIYLRRLQTVNAVRELLSCSTDDFKLFVQTATMNNPDVFGIAFLREIIDIRSWTSEEARRA